MLCIQPIQFNANSPHNLTINISVDSSFLGITIHKEPVLGSSKMKFDEAVNLCSKGYSIRIQYFLKLEKINSRKEHKAWQ